MLTFPPSIRVFVATFPVDMRKGIDALYALALQSLGASPLHGHVVVAFSRRRDHVKVLWFDRGGFAVLHKRLEQGRFAIALVGESGHVEVDTGALALLLQGLDPSRVERPKVWCPPTS